VRGIDTIKRETFPIVGGTSESLEVKQRKRKEKKKKEKKRKEEREREREREGGRKKEINNVSV
jgi:hypothetical protein